MKKVISIHIKDGKVLDVSGISSDTEIVVTDVDTMEEVSFTSKENIQ